MQLVSLALILAACCASTHALAGARQEAKVLMAPDPASLKFQQDWGFSDAVVTGDTIDLTTQMPAIVAVKNNYVKQPFPAWTAIQVSRLTPTNGITEIKIVAKLRR